jgi:dipeptidyl aminopeptidase/acylaminoacyl peptidase
MPRFIAIAVIFILSVSIRAAADNTPVAVAITKRTPIETLSPTGNVVGVNEATVGTRLNLVSADGSKVTLQDAQGTRYRIALSSTDYIPPIGVASTAINSAPQTPPPVVIASAVVAPVQPIKPAPKLPDNSSTVASSQNQQAPLADSPVFTVKIGDRATANEMSVWPQGGVPDQPLLIAAHGNGGSGPKEINGWLRIAKEHHFTIVCPSFLSSVNSGHLSEDDPYFKECIKWIKDNLKYSSDNVFMTGFSGGGYPTWGLATKYPDFFHGLIFQSGNFPGGYYPPTLSRWFNKPIKLIWGSQDMSDSKRSGG